MSKLTTADIEEIKVLYDKGVSSNSIGNLFDVTGSYIRKLAKENGWKRQAQVKKNVKSKEAVQAELAVILKRARAPENYGVVGNEYVKQSILYDSKHGISQSAASKRVGLRHDQIASWRKRDPEFDRAISQAQADFVAWHEMNAGEAQQSPKDSLNLLSRHPWTKAEWSPQQENKNVIKIEFAYNRHGNNVIDAEYEEVPQIENKS